MWCTCRDGWSGDGGEGGALWAVEIGTTFILGLVSEHWEFECEQYPRDDLSLDVPAIPLHAPCVSSVKEAIARRRREKEWVNSFDTLVSRCLLLKGWRSVPGGTVKRPAKQRTCSARRGGLSWTSAFRQNATNQLALEYHLRLLGHCYDTSSQSKWLVCPSAGDADGNDSVQGMALCMMRKKGHVSVYSQ